MVKVRSSSKVCLSHDINLDSSCCAGSGELLLVQSKEDIERPPLELRATVVVSASGQ